MSEKPTKSERVYGFKKRHVTLYGNYDGMGPDAPWLVRWVLHFLASLAWNCVPAQWAMRPDAGWRYRVWFTMMQFFVWWAYSHHHREWPLTVDRQRG